MIQLTEQQIASMAPNASAASNGKKISQKGGFVKLEFSSDESFYQGECTGSGRTNYITSADYQNPLEPVFRCSCPSRQFPCKHSLALLYEILAGKTFEICEIPDDIINKRTKKQAKIEKSSEPAPPEKVNKAARNKKIKKQLEGLALTEKVMNELMLAGLGTLKGTSIKTYQNLAKQLGDYYLPGPQLYINRLILEMEAIQADADMRHHENAVHILIQLRALIKKATEYLSEKQKNDNMAFDDTILFEELGGIWKTDQLQQLGLYKENATLLQLSFWVISDKARCELIDLAYWADLETGEIVTTRNYRPFKALKYVKEDDSIFEIQTVTRLTYYPGDLNRRVRFDRAGFLPAESSHFIQLRDKACPELTSAVKTLKNYIKNTLADNYAALLVQYHKLSLTDAGYVLEDVNGKSILFADMPDMEATTDRIPLLADPSLLEDQVLLGLFFYDGTKRRIFVQPLSILTKNAVIRLLY